MELVHNTRRSSLQLQHRWGNRSSTAYFQLGLFRPKSQVVFPAWLFFMTHKAWLTSSHLNVFRLSCANGTERGADFSCPYSRRSLSKASSLRFLLSSGHGTLSVAMRVNCEDCSLARIHGRDATPTPAGFAEIVSDDFPIHADQFKEP